MNTEMGEYRCPYEKSLSSNFTIEFLSQGALMLPARLRGAGQFCIVLQFRMSGMDGVIRLTKQMKFIGLWILSCQYTEFVFKG